MKIVFLITFFLLNSLTLVFATESSLSNSEAKNNKEMVNDKESNTEESSAKAATEDTRINYKADEEESIPILTKNKNKAEDQSNTLYKTISTIFIVFTLGGLGVWYLKKKSKLGLNNPSAMQIKVLTQFHLAPKKTLTVIRVAGESLLLGVTENQITLIKSLSLLDEDIPDATPKNFRQTIAESSADASVDKPPKNTILKSAEFGDSDEEFSFGNIKHLVENKLKGMKRW